MAGHYRGGRGVANMKFNTSGKLLTEGFFNDFMQWIFDIVQAGKGIRLEKGNGKIIISSDAVGGAVGGGASVLVLWVTELPPIPTSPQEIKRVYWATAEEMEGGTADVGQIWETGPGQTRWYPAWTFTDSSGIPLP